MGSREREMGRGISTTGGEFNNTQYDAGRQTSKTQCIAPQEVYLTNAFCLLTSQHAWVDKRREGEPERR